MRKYILPASLAFLFISTAAAAEIQYAQVTDVADSEVHITYSTPQGPENFVCDVATDPTCQSYGTSTPTLFPTVWDTHDYTKSPNGKYAITNFTIESETGSTTHVHTLYNITGSEVKLERVIPFTQKIDSYRFSWSDKQVLLFAGNTIGTYDITIDTFSLIETEQHEFPFRSIAPSGDYFAAYNYVNEAHHIWNTSTGEKISAPSNTPNFVEFSQNGQFAAFVADVDGFDTLQIVDLTQDEPAPTRVFTDNFTIDSIMFYNDDLFAVGNTADDPYDWVLYRYDVTDDQSHIVAQNVSYASYIRPIATHGLSFQQINGKNTNIGLYRPTSDAVDVIEPVEPSPASDQIRRSTVTFDDVHGVLYEPTTTSSSRADLFIWLHGGPKRQTSLGYHSYLSYAVYDKLLERLVEGGSYVLKLDFTGSYGFGNEFMDGLDEQLGVADTADVIKATQEVQQQHRIKDTYLIGNSYGGYLGPKALVEAPELFAGAVAINGVFDWFTLLERIPSSPFQQYFSGLVNLEDLEENYNLYRNASVIKGVPDLTDEKIVLIYGEDDSTVPTWQTREFFYLAESFGKDVSLLRLEEDHIIRNRENLDKMCEFIVDKLSLPDVSCQH